MQVSVELGRNTRRKLAQDECTRKMYLNRGVSWKKTLRGFGNIFSLKIIHLSKSTDQLQSQFFSLKHFLHRL